MSPGREAERPLTEAEVAERPTAEEVAALWASVCAEPIPEYVPEALRRFPPKVP